MGSGLVGDGFAYRPDPTPGYAASPSSGDMAKWAAAGGTHAVVLAGWDVLETADGTWNTTNVAAVQSKIEEAWTAGLHVILEPGLQYPPAWAQSAIAPFKNQSGTEYLPSDAASKVRDWVWTATGRTILGDFLTGLLSRLDLTHVGSVRLGGSWYNELQFPAWNYGISGQIAYWCFSTAAQTGTGIASGMTSATAAGIAGYAYDSGGLSDAGGWTPTTNDNTFQSWYTGSLTTFAGWMVDTVATEWGGPIWLMFPGVGLRDVHGKNSQGWRQELAEGKDWGSHITALFPTRPKLRGWCTWVDYDDNSTTDVATMSPSRYLRKRLVDAGYGARRIGGENANAEDRTARRQAFANTFASDGAFGDQDYDLVFYVQWHHLELDADSDLNYLAGLIP